MQARAENASAGVDTDTIAALATPPGRGGIGVIRISGPRAAEILRSLAGRSRLHRRRAELVTFRDSQGEPIDQGIALYFPAPHSFTGETVVELQGHGGPVVMDRLLAAAIERGARPARPGEFTERAFLNEKIDLAQAEAVADLIDSASVSAARNAARSLQGAFSERIEALAAAVTELRVHVEAAIDFADEEVDFLADGDVRTRGAGLLAEVERTIDDARQGVLLTEGIHLTLAGRPNVGKSSLLNRLAGHDRAIVTEIAGTTRDTLQEEITLDGIPVRLVDTAGLRISEDVVEREGVKRAKQASLGADRVLLVTETSDPEEWRGLIEEQGLDAARVTIVQNKIDLSGAPPGRGHEGDGSGPPLVRVSALTGAGVESLIGHLKELVGFREEEGLFSARRRHLLALESARAALQRGLEQLERHGAGELLAEELRDAHDSLGEIVGKVSADALLGEIFSSFCIGK